MFIESQGALHEVGNSNSLTVGTAVPLNGMGQAQSMGYWPDYLPHYQPLQPIYWNSYPVYVCTDKTKKAIEVLKALQADKMLTCNSVPRFIELVEKIAGLL